MDDLEIWKYPIGRFTAPAALDPETRRACIDALERLPATMRSLAGSLSDSQLDRPYRAGGWTIRQVVHHVPESHMNMYIRMRLALTEDVPTIKPYDENRWAELPDSRSAPVSLSLDLLEALHRRWVVFLRMLSGHDFQRSFRHPDSGIITIDQGIAAYDWHGRHHAAHIERALTVEPGR